MNAGIHDAAVTPELHDVLTRHGGVATSAQILDQVSRRAMQRLLLSGQLIKIWPGVYSRGPADVITRLRGLDLRLGDSVPVCLGTAANAFGFDTEDVTDLHVLNPVGHSLRSGDGLVVHRRAGAPLNVLDGRQLTAPGWTAIEVARGLRRPRALATLDAALRSRTCSRGDLLLAAAQQAGRRGIVTVRELIALATPKAESPMESEARLAMHDGNLPSPVLQYPVVDDDGRSWRVDFAWPDLMVAVEYDGFDWHSSPDHLRRDRQKRAALQEAGWRIIGIVADDVRNHPREMVRRIEVQLARVQAA